MQAYNYLTHMTQAKVYFKTRILQNTMKNLDSHIQLQGWDILISVFNYIYIKQYTSTPEVKCFHIETKFVNYCRTLPMTFILATHIKGPLKWKFCFPFCCMNLLYVPFNTQQHHLNDLIAVK